MRFHWLSVASAAGLVCVSFLFFTLLLFLDPLPPVAVPDSQIHPSSKPPSILLVSAFYPLKKSKHTHDDYKAWLTTFLGTITTDVYFYTTEDFARLVRNVRGDRPLFLNTTFRSPFDIPPLANLEAAYTSMHEIDRERFRHAPDLYAVWNAKPFFLDAAISLLASEGHTYDYVFWNDAGSFRNEHSYAAWPDPQRVYTIFRDGAAALQADPRELILNPIWNIPTDTARTWVENDGPVEDDFSQGSFFGGSPLAVNWWRRTFYAYHDHYLSRGMFVGKDQSVYNAIYLLFPSRFITAWAQDPHAPERAGLLPPFDEGMLGQCGGPWWYYQFWLASEKEREGMHALWKFKMRWTADWWVARQRCRLANMLTMPDVLTKTLGPKWKPPVATVRIPDTWRGRLLLLLP